MVLAVVGAMHAQPTVARVRHVVANLAPRAVLHSLPDDKGSLLDVFIGHCIPLDKGSFVLLLDQSL